MTPAAYAHTSMPSDFLYILDNDSVRRKHPSEEEEEEEVEEAEEEEEEEEEEQAKRRMYEKLVTGSCQ